MGAFVFKVLRGKFKVNASKKRKKPKIQVQQQQPVISRPADRLPYFGRSWPGVVGLTASEAESRIKRDCPGVYCQVVSMNQLLTMCYRSHRVRIMVDRYGKVAKTPRVG